MQLTVQHQLSLRAQRLFGHLNLFWFGPLFLFLLRFIGRYQCLEIKSVRAKLEAILAEHPQRPVLICANHLTMIDSILLTRYLFSFPSLIWKFQRFPWNIPELRNFGVNPFSRLMCYLGKCVYVERQGSPASRKLSWQKVNWLNQQGDFLCVFPEGGRSRIGRIDREKAVYGVGQIVQDNPRTLVICAYIRGMKQGSFSFFPQRGEQFFLDIAECKLQISEGRRGQRDITNQILDQLEGLEQKYFAARL